MPDIILHHYPESLYSEKVRLILGLKNLDWKSVIIPMVAPKPDLTALTGGYRRTPVLQIGADVYCDTALIADVLERIAPGKSLYAPGQQGVVQTIAQWGDSNLFWAAIAYFYQTDGVAMALAQLPPAQVEAYHRDRAELLRTRPLSGFAETKATLSLYLQRLQQMLEGGRPFLLGDAVYPGRHFLLSPAVDPADGAADCDSAGRHAPRAGLDGSRAGNRPRAACRIFRDGRARHRQEQSSDGHP